MCASQSFLASHSLLHRKEQNPMRRCRAWWRRKGRGHARNVTLSPFGPRLHWSQNITTANQHMSGYTSPDTWTYLMALSLCTRLKVRYRYGCHTISWRYDFTLLFHMGPRTLKTICSRLTDTIRWRPSMLCRLSLGRQHLAAKEGQLTGYYNVLLVYGSTSEEIQICFA